jgi:hypothetical protein
MMSSKKDKSGEKTSGYLDMAFRTGLDAAEDIQKRAFDVPLTLLEGLGAPKEKIDMLRDKSQSLIGELYTAINSVADQVESIGSSDKAKK